MPDLNSPFRTVLPIQSLPFKLNLKSKVLTVGSCFSDAMGKRLIENKIETLNNPFGTIFNAPAIYRLINSCIKNENNFGESTIESNSIWYNYDLHSSVSAESKTELLDKINSTVKHTHNFIKTADLLIITFGTAVGYELKSSGKIVANCHKIPQQNFNKKLISADEIVEGFNEMLSKLLHINPSLKILITVSPVRHIKETLELNSVSKSILRVACHQLLEVHPQVHYFPSYEIMMDDLRDYRFYADDMIHPSIFAEDYIWQRFTEAGFDMETLQFITEWKNIKLALSHKAFHPQAAAHQQFIASTIEKIKKLQNTFSVNAASEIELLQSQLNP